MIPATRGTAAVVDVGHRAGRWRRHGDTAEERYDDVGGALCDEFRIGIVAVAVTPSATVAESSDSMAPSMAMVKAGGSRPRMVSRLKENPAGAGMAGLML